MKVIVTLSSKRENVERRGRGNGEREEKSKSAVRTKSQKA